MADTFVPLSRGALSARMVSGSPLTHAMAQSLVALLPQQSILNATSAPSVDDDSSLGYAVGSLWIDTNNDKIYVCVSSQIGSAVWTLVGRFTAADETKLDGVGDDADVQGPSGATDNALSRFDGTTGKIIQESGWILDDNDDMKLPDGAAMHDSSGNELLTFTKSSNALNHLNVKNTAVGGPTLGSVGDATDIDLKITTKAAGRFRVNNAAMISEPHLCEVGGHAVGGSVALTSDRAYWLYLGKYSCQLTVEFIKWNQSSAASGSQTAEVACATGDTGPDGSTITLTKVWAIGDAGSQSNIDDLTSAGFVGNVNANTTIVSLDKHIFVGFRLNMATTQGSARPVQTMDTGIGKYLITSSVGALTDAGPWTGSVLTATDSHPGIVAWLKEE